MSLSKLDRDEITSMIKVTVNGKIDKMSDKLDQHIDMHSSIQTELTTVVDAIRWINTTRKFILWIGATAAAVASFFTLGNYFK